jgi:hypothetical protein
VIPFEVTVDLLKSHLPSIKLISTGPLPPSFVQEEKTEPKIITETNTRTIFFIVRLFKIEIQ